MGGASISLWYWCCMNLIISLLRFPVNIKIIFWPGSPYWVRSLLPMLWRSGNSWLAATNLFCHLPSVNSLIIMALCAYINGLAQYSQILQGRTVGFGITKPPICSASKTAQYCQTSAWSLLHDLTFKGWAQQHLAHFIHFRVKIAWAAPLLKCASLYNL